MARITEITCDSCGYTGGSDGDTPWLVAKQGKRQLEFDSMDSLSKWVAAQPRQAWFEDAETDGAAALREVR